MPMVPPLHRKTKWKILNLVLIAISLAIYIGIELYWQYTCVSGNCSVNFMEGTLSSLKVMSVTLFVIFLSFVMFPAKYFKRYITVWFWWLFILALSIAVATDPIGDSIISFNRSQVVLALGVIGVFQAIFFLYRTKKKAKKTEL